MTLHLTYHNYEMIHYYWRFRGFTISEIFFEKLNFAKLISGHLHKCMFSFYSIFLFSESSVVLSHRNRVGSQDLKGI